MGFSRFAVIFITITNICTAQIEPDRTLYGHEWIDENSTYYKITVSEDGIYRLDASLLQNAGIPIANLEGSQLYIMNNGVQVPLVVSTDGPMSPDDYILFRGYRNRGEVDNKLYENPTTSQLNAEYSLYTDDNTYYLSWNSNANNFRYQNLVDQYDPERLPPLERFYQHTERKIFNEFHFKPTHNGRDFIRYSSYDIGEGYGSEIRKVHTIPFSLDNIYTGGTRPKLAARFSGNAVTHFLQTSIGDLVLDRYVNQGYGVNDFETEFNNNHLKEELEVTIEGLQSDSDRSSISSVSITYPRTYNFQGKSQFSFELTPSFIPRYLEIENFDHEEVTPKLWDLANDQLLECVLEDGIVKVVLPPNTKTRELLLVNENKEIQRITEVSSYQKDIDLDAIGDYLIISNQELYNDGAGNDRVREYADYRSTVAGGSYNPTIIDVNALYDLFSYGVNGHALAIKNFIQYLKDQNHDLKAIFIIGRGLEYPFVRKKDTLNGNIRCLVPTFGSPGGDNLFASDGYEVNPKVPIGRLAAQSPDDVKNYLDKVKTFEREVDYADDDKLLWRKKILHLSGGSADIQDILFEYLGDMKDVIESNHFGADVFTFRKKNADLLQSSQTNEIIGKINDGVSLITFFGHAAVGTFDFSLEDPSRYDNQEKTPIILSLGCHSGNIHSDGIGLSEDFVLEKDKGAVAFIAASGTAYINPQYESGLNFYNGIGSDLANKSVGEVVLNSLKSIAEDENIRKETLAQQLTIHGDPVLKFFMSDGPDYASRYESFNVTPGILNSTIDSFDLTFEIINRGSYKEEKIELLIEHISPDGEVIFSQMVNIDAPSYIQEHTITLPNPGITAVGQNQIALTIDPDNKISEFPSQTGETNNTINNPEGDNLYAFLILDNKAKPIYPKEFGIHNDDVIRLNATSDNGLMPLNSYVIEIDTTEKFNSVLLTREIIQSNNSVISWEPDIQHLDNTVYYWRLSPNTLTNNEKRWETSSFLFSPGERDGWNQSHFYQWQKNDYQNLYLDTITRRLTFDKRTWDIRVKNELLNQQDYWVFINGTPWASLNPRQLAPAMSVFIWHPKDILLKNSGRDYGSLQFSSDAFLYRMNSPADRLNLVRLLDNTPEGSRIFMHTILKDENSNLNIDDWSNDMNTVGVDIFETLKGYGAQKFEQLKEKGTVPYTYIFDKGVGPVAEDIANSIYETIDLSSIGKTFWDQGKLDASSIGPVKRFLKLEWEEKKTGSDETELIVLGETHDGKLDTLRRISNKYEANLTFIHPEEYPTIKLAYNVSDPDDKSSSELLWWRVFYQDLPDISFDISEATPSIPDTLESGEAFTLNYGIRNLSEESVENFRIKYVISNSQNQNLEFYSEDITIDGDGYLPIAFDFTEILEEGEYRITVFINSEQSPNERTFDNNIGVLKFFVQSDKRDPILDVKVNEKGLNANDYVLSTSDFSVSIRNPDSGHLIDDPSVFFINLEYPSGRVIEIDESQFSFIPAVSGQSNTAYALFSPDLSEQGQYTLTVIADDRIKKSFERVIAEIPFRVDNRKLLEDVEIFPNPVKNFAQIDVKIQGSEMPEDFAIRIFTADGKLIQMINKSEFDNIQTAPNTRSHLWKTKDENGLDLPSGNYIINVSGRKIGSNINLNRKVVVLK